MRMRDENKLEAIREQAMDIIVKEGFDGLSMQKLARAANVSPATIYIYFRNREDLLNQLFNHVQQTFSDVVLEGFHQDLSFEKGLWLQWKNRLRFVTQFPVHYTFHEQFRNSPLINHDDVKLPLFRESMKQFIKNAIKNGELRKTEPEIFWAIAYGPLYTLIRFHIEKKSMMNRSFTLSDAKLKEAFRLVMNALRP